MRYVDELAQAIEIIPEKLYFTPLRRPDALSVSPTARKAICFSIDNELVYEPFFADFGPLNLGLSFKFCEKTSSLLKEGERTGQPVYYCCSSHPQQIANAAVLIGLYQVMVLGRPADVAYEPLKHLQPFVPFRDPTCGVSTFHLNVIDCLKGMQKAKEVGFVNFTNNTFDVEEYQYYEQVEHGDLNWIVPGKWVAFSGPASKRTEYYGYRSLIPEDYIEYYKHKGVTGVIRLNKKAYDRRKFTDSGIHHYDLYFHDGSCPPDHILKRFLEIADSDPGALAVHCKAGLGRTGVLICCWIMKFYGFTAEEVLGYIRIVRPGSVIGPQQQYLRDYQARMWKEGELHRQRQANATAASGMSSRSSSASSDRTSVRDSIPDVERRTSPMKSMRTGTHPTVLNGISRQMAGTNLNGTPDSADGGGRQFERYRTNSYSPGSVRSASSQSSALSSTRSMNRRTSAMTTSSPAFLPPRRDVTSSGPTPPSSNMVSSRYSMPNFTNPWSSMRTSRGTTQPTPAPITGRSSSASDATQRPQPYHTGFHTTPSQQKPSSSVSRILAPNGQPRKVLTASLSSAGNNNPPASPSSVRYSNIRMGFNSALNRGRRE